MDEKQEKMLYNKELALQIINAKDNGNANSAVVRQLTRELQNRQRQNTEVPMPHTGTAGCLSKGLFVGGGIIGILTLILLFVSEWDFEVSMPFIVITLLLLLMGCLCLCGSKLENKAYHRAKSKLQESVRPVYAEIERECQSFSNKYHKPEDYRTLNLFSGEKVDCWKNSNSLYILSDTGQLDRILNEMGNLVCDGDTSLVTEYMIPMTSIQYFRVDGDFYRENKISGGGGGGVNIKGALIGHLLAGNAGAIIGSRRKVEAIKSELIVHDDRKVILYYLADENAQQLSELVFDYGDYNELLKLIPEKEYNTAIAQMSAASNVQETAPVDQSSIKERLLELKSLKDEGLISTSEFEKKKEELLKSL